MTDSLFIYNNQAIMLSPNVLLKGATSGSFVVITCSRYLATLTCGTQSYTLTGTETSHAFSVSAGTYTCTASLTGYETVTGTVTVTTDNVYSITLTPRQLPSIYQEVEYIHVGSTGPYINTGWTPSSAVVTLEFSAVMESDANAGNLFGVSNLSQDADWLVNPATNTGSTKTKGAYIGSSTQIFTMDFSTYRNVHTVVLDTGNLYTYKVNGITQKSGSYNGSFLNNPSSLILFSTGGPNTLSQTLSYTSLYTFKISENNILVRSLIPCYRISDSKPGMYDTVTSTFLTNAGSGEFTVGPDV